MKTPDCPPPDSINQSYSSIRQLGLFVHRLRSFLPAQPVCLAIARKLCKLHLRYQPGGSNPYGGLPSYFVSEIAGSGLQYSWLRSHDLFYNDLNAENHHPYDYYFSQLLTELQTSTSTSTASSSVTNGNSSTTLTVNTVLANGQSIPGYALALSTANGTQVWSIHPRSLPCK